MSSRHEHVLPHFRREGGQQRGKVHLRRASRAARAASRASRRLRRAPLRQQGGNERETSSQSGGPASA